MQKKIIGILFCMLLIAAAVLPAAGTMNKNENIVIEDQNQVNQDQVKSEPQCSAVSSVDDEWPMFLHDLENTGYSTSSIAPQTNTVKWTYTADFFVYGSPAVVNGKVYIGSDDEYLYCLDAETGGVLWQHFISGGIGVGSPSVYEDKVYIGGIYDYIYCLDADTGASIWESYTGYDGLKWAIKPYAGKVYVGIDAHSGVNEGVLYCLDADTGDKIWIRDDLGYYEVSSPAVYDGKVYIVSGPDLYCFDADTGDKLWDYGGGCTAGCSPTIFDGRVYCGAGRLNCLDADTGEELWHFDKSAWTSPAVAYGNVYFSGSAGLFCLDAYTGEEIWNYPPGTSSLYSRSCPAVADLKIYLGIESTGKLICVDAETGEKIWDYQTATPGWMYNSPAIAYGRVYMGGGGTGNVYCFEDPSKPPQDPTIDGPTDGFIDRDHEFEVRTTDPEGNDVKYYVDWGDDNNTSWIGPYPSGKKVTVSHAWSEPGTYSVRVRAEDSFGIKGHWSEHVITVVDAPALEIQIIKGGLSKISTVVKNYGCKDASDVSWSIILDGGFILLGRETTGTIDSISVDGEASVNSGFILGLGSTMVMVNATVPVGFSDTREQKASVFLFFINVKPGG